MSIGKRSIASAGVAAALALSGLAGPAAASGSTETAREGGTAADARARLAAGLRDLGGDGRRTAAAAGSERLEVRLRPGASAADAVAEGEELGGVLPVRLSELRAFSLQVPRGEAEAARAALLRHPDVLDVAPARLRRLSFLPSDADWSRQGPYLEAIGLPQAWERTQGSSTVRIAVVDSGVDVTHPDLRRADGTSKVVGTYNAVTGGTAVPDAIGHGTFVAGVAAASTDNGRGVAGAGFSSSLLAVKVDDAQGRIYSDAVASGVRWAVDHGADVVNLSLGSSGTSALEQDAMAYARSRGVVVVAAAGNDGSSTPVYPAALPGVLSVGATHGASRASFSNHGSWVDVGAPGVGLLSTSPMRGSTSFAPEYDDGDGTSFSAPLVAGGVALLAAAHPSAGADALVRAVTGSTTGSFGFTRGRVHVARALASLEPHAATVTQVSPSPFSPDGDGRRDAAGITYQLDSPGAATLTVTTSSGVPVRGPVALGMRPAGTGSTSWDGRDDSGTVVPDGSYLVRVSLGRPGLPEDTSVGHDVVVDRRAPGMTGLTGAGSTFFPARDGYRDTFTPALTVDEPLAGLQLRISDARGRLLRSIAAGPRPAGRVSLAWDGRRPDGSAYPAGSYRFSFVAQDLASNERATASYGVTLSPRRMVARSGSATVTPAASRTQLLVGRCSLVRTPATGTGWSGSYEYLSAVSDACYASSDDLAASLHRFTLPAAAAYGNVKVSAYGKSFPGYADRGGLLYLDRYGSPTSTGTMMGAAPGTYSGPSVPASAWLDSSRTVRWAAATNNNDWYQVRSFTVTWTYYVLA